MRAPLWTCLMSIQELFNDFFNFLFLIFWYAGGCRSEHVPCQTAIRRAVDFFVFLFLFVIFWYAGGRCCKRAPCHTTIRRAVASFLFLFSIIVWFGMQKGAATHVSHVTQELLNFFFLFIIVLIGMQENAATHVSHVTKEYETQIESFFVYLFIFWYAGGRRCECVPCYTPEHTELLEVCFCKFHFFFFFFPLCRRAPLWTCPMLLNNMKWCSNSSRLPSQTSRYVYTYIFLQKRPTISGSFAKNDLQLKASYGSSPPYILDPIDGLRFIDDIWYFYTWSRHILWNIIYQSNTSKNQMIWYRVAKTYLVALLRKMTCNLRHPMGLRHPYRVYCL